MINTLQMIVLTVLFSVNMPPNCYKVMIAIMKLTNLDIFPTESFLQDVFSFKAETSSLNAVFEQAGYESSNFVMELGALTIIITGTVVF